MFEGSFVNIKSPNLRNNLREILKKIIYVNLREDKPSVNIFLRMIAINGSSDIWRKLTRISYSSIYLN
jgi:hypothetical protein